jgi:ADP-heptose:LPS heptosyltransferase
MKIKNKKAVKKILFISLSNIGDIILTTPVLAVLRREFPSAAIDVLSGPNGAEIFAEHPFVSSFIKYDKFARLPEKQHLIRQLRANRYDLIVDLRNSLFPLLIGSRYRTSVIRRPAGRGTTHKKQQHLRKIKRLGLDISNAPFAFYVAEKDKESALDLLSTMGIMKNFVVVSPGAKSHIKRWTKEGFAAVCDRLINEAGLDVLMVGDAQDKKIIAEISALMKEKAVDLSGRLTLRQLGALIQRSGLLVTNDSAPMHVGASLGVKMLAIFGPTDPKKYGPTHPGSIVVRQELACAPCEKAQCRMSHECMRMINPEEVFKAAKNLL